VPVLAPLLVRALEIVAIVSELDHALIQENAEIGPLSTMVTR
jgi:hypothetical protein